MISNDDLTQGVKIKETTIKPTKKYIIRWNKQNIYQITTA